MHYSPPLPGLGGTYRKVYLKSTSRTLLALEWRCVHCYTWVRQDAVWFVTPMNRLEGRVYCDVCLPNHLRPNRRRAC